ncbi:hypothetical protein H5410_059918 [Solanum commersonii]|uniref:Uncharacterized protein n=1 Tax=Solanum commersonii TaxID=4109 RepID=A0A9J5W4G1_SOLCO|nr:hypothetical protein H5410_059918 [Solanum commersonii]
MSIEIDPPSLPKPHPIFPHNISYISGIRNCDPNKHKFHLVKWNEVLVSKKEGGLGTRNLKIQNHSLLIKLLWRSASQEQSLWKDTIKARYGMETRWISNIATQPYDTGVWRTIRNLWPKLINKCTIKIGDGGKVLFY